MYLVGECGNLVVESKCLGCGRTIGGTGHAVSAANPGQVARAPVHL